MVEVGNVEARAVVETNRHFDASVKRPLPVALRGGDVLERDDPHARSGKRLEIGGKRDVIVAAVIVPADVVRVPGEDDPPRSHAVAARRSRRVAGSNLS